MTRTKGTARPALPPFRTVGLALFLALVISACGGSSEQATDEVATLATDNSVTMVEDESSEADSSGELSGDEANAILLDYAVCMREEGLEEFPDLSLADGQAGAIRDILAAGIDLQGDAFADAQDACRDLLGELVDAVPEPSADEREEGEALLLDIAVCLRANGYPDFPDPDLSAGLGPQAFAEGVREAGISIVDPDFLAAVGVCQRELGLENLGTIPSGSG